MTSRLSPDDRAELNRIWAELTAALRVIERLLGDDDPTGLTYSREDDEPVAAPTRPHDGFAVTGRNQRPTKQGEAGTRGLASPTLSGGAR